MTFIGCETPRYALHYDSRYGIGFVKCSADGATTPLITGSDLVEFRRALNRAKTNATSERKRYRPFAEIADPILADYVLDR